MNVKNERPRPKVSDGAFAVTSFRGLDSEVGLADFLVLEKFFG